MLGTEPHIVERYVRTGKVKLVYRHILDHGARSLAASEAAECAGEHGLFWAMHDVLYAQQETMWRGDARQQVLELARDVEGLDIDSFARCMRDGRYRSKVEQDDAMRRQLRIRVRPTIDINGRRVEGAVPFESLQPIMESALESGS